MVEFSGPLAMIIVAIDCHYGRHGLHSNHGHHHSVGHHSNHSQDSHGDQPGGPLAVQLPHLCRVGDVARVEQHRQNPLLVQAGGNNFETQ